MDGDGTPLFRLGAEMVRSAVTIVVFMSPLANAK
jgi:hypothetical protein